MHTIDIIIVIAYLVLCILIALYKLRSIKSIEKGREEVAKDLLLQGVDISIIENATGLSIEDLSALQKSIKTAH